MVSAGLGVPLSPKTIRLMTTLPTSTVATEVGRAFEAAGVGTSEKACHELDPAGLSLRRNR